MRFPALLVLALCSGLAATVAVLSCTSSSSAANDCAAAGGVCVLGNVICAVPGPQSCGATGPAGLYCCLNDIADCGQPDAATFSCPASGGDGACIGPPPVPLGTPNYGNVEEAGDPDASYPSGCTVTFPACNNGNVPTCTCTGPGWTCTQ